jgi:pimeloyl-ACP methyl ester carboxylesterase
MTIGHTFFWVGVERLETANGTVPINQMYVERVAPDQPTRKHPVVLVHGGGGQGLDWLGTPDGRSGWAPMLAADGYEVFVVDRPGHGRSPYHPDLLGPMTPPPSYEVLEGVFTPPTDSPLGAGHTEWPAGVDDAPGVIDQLLAGGGPMRADMPSAHALEQRALAALLDRVGPAVVITHSAGGPAGFLAAEARPGAVVALVTIEPLGPPFLRIAPIGVSLDWGLAAAPFEFDPPASDPAELEDGTGRRLVNLSKVPIILVSTAHSKLGAAGAETVAFLRSAGCDAEEMKLAENGFAGNGHGVMLERNNAEVLEFLLAQLRRRGLI